MITLQGAIEKSPILLSQYWKNEWFDGTIIIYYFGGSNNIFANCMLNSRSNVQYKTVQFYTMTYFSNSGNTSTVGKKLLLPPKYEIIMVPSNHSLFSIAPCKVSTLNSFWYQCFASFLMAFFLNLLLFQL